MNQMKIGAFLRELRKEKGLTQEQLAEHFNVTSRSVSRWETGSNLPDLDILIGISDFYDVDLREILNGERKSEKMDKELKETVEKVAEYCEAGKERLKRKMMENSIAAAFLLIFAALLNGTNGFGFIPPKPCQNMMDFASGLALAILVLNALYLGGILERIKGWKNRISKK